MLSKTEFLQSLPIFANLDETDLAALAQIATEYEYPERSLVVYQRDVADRFFIVRTGRLVAYSMDERGNLVAEKNYFAGDYFNDEWLFTPFAYSATIKTTVTSRIIVILSKDFLTFLEKNPHILAKLTPIYDEETEKQIAGLSEKGWESARHSRLAVPPRLHRSAKLLPEELIIYQSRRSKWLLVWRIGLPVLSLGLLAVIAALVVLPRINLGVVGISEGIIWLILFFLILFVVAYQYLDWWNDYFLISTKHLVHNEFNLRTFRTKVSKTPIDQVQSVEIDKPTLLANILKVGTARITTASTQGTIYFDLIDDPIQVVNALNELRQRVQQLDAGKVQATMRASIEKHFNISNSSTPIPDENEVINSAKPAPKGFFANFKQFIGYRVEQANTITYRKHFFVLLDTIKYPFGIMIGLSILYLLIVSPSLRLLDTGFFLVNLIWLIWQMEDWRNDTYQLTDDFVIDVDRSPFGFSEKRKQATLSNIQNVRADRPNLLATLFNYGNVHIETAGASSDIMFENVSDPNQVQSDIFKRREQYQQKQRVQEGEHRRKEYAVLLDVYQQAVEQERIPSRTKPR